MATLDRKSSSLVIMGCVLACVVSATGCVGPARVPDADFSVAPWAADGLVGRQVTTPHYVLFSTLRNGHFELQVAKRMELLYARYTATVDPLEKAAPPLRVFVLDTRADYARLANRGHANRPTVLTMGKFAGLNGRDLIVVAGDRAKMLAGMAHHGWHQYINTKIRSRLPAWLDEGLACDFESLQFAKGRAAARGKRNATRIATLRKLLRGAATAPLSQVVSRNVIQSTGPQIGHYDERFQAQVWALVSLLRDGAGGKFAGAFDHLLDDMANGAFGVHASALTLTSRSDDPVSLGEAALRVYFDKNSTELEDVYFDHLVRLCGF